MDLLTLFGVLLGFTALLGGNFLDGGSLSMLMNGPAAVIVFGGTLGAAILQTPKDQLNRALSLFVWVFQPPKLQCNKGIKDIVRWAKAARRDGLLGLENIAELERDQFKRKGLRLLVDGSPAEVIRHVMETDLMVAEQRDHDAVNFYESMGGYAPTIGIIGAVMGLIHVMQHLASPDELGPGIAVAFVATIYGVAFANLVLLPVASKLRTCIKQTSEFRELIIEGLLAIADGENPRAIELRLSGYVS